HRYFLYLGLLFILFLTHDVWLALWVPAPTTGDAAGEEFGMGVGTLVLAVNVILLSGYTFGCHSMRHLVGGGIDRLSEAPLRHGAYLSMSVLRLSQLLTASVSLLCT